MVPLYPLSGQVKVSPKSIQYIQYISTSVHNTCIRNSIQYIQIGCTQVYYTRDPGYTNTGYTVYTGWPVAYEPTRVREYRGNRDIATYLPSLYAIYATAVRPRLRILRTSRLRHYDILGWLIGGLRVYRVYYLLLVATALARHSIYSSITASAF